MENKEKLPEKVSFLGGPPRCMVPERMKYARDMHDRGVITRVCMYGKRGMGGGLS